MDAGPPPPPITAQPCAGDTHHDVISSEPFHAGQHTAATAARSTLNKTQGADGEAHEAARERALRAAAEARPAPPFAALTPPEAARQLQVLERAAAARGEPRLAEALALARSLALARPYLRHDPACAHLRPTGVGATRCTCGLDAALRGRA
ncbi:MAG: hypothetical protein RL071_1128 [Pseudomonadota bacterium]|jgi:hypothetical protein